MNSENVNSVLSLADGVLVGSGSRDWEKFKSIIEKASQRYAP